MSKKRGLGKGLEALLGSETLTATPAGIQTVLLTQLQPNPYQPRKTFDPESLATLVDSIRQHGIIQPLAVRKKQADEKYEIIAGERRFRAAQQAGLTELPVVIHDINDHDSATFALIENLQREDLNAIELAKGIKQLIDTFGLTHEACGKALGQSRTSISNMLRLLTLDHAVQSAVINQHIEMGHARALVGLEIAEQHEILEKIRLHGLSVRETENLVRDLKNNQQPVTRHQKNKQVKQMEVLLSEHLQTKVNISQQKSGAGKITLAFSDEKTLMKLSQRLGVEKS